MQVRLPPWQKQALQLLAIVVLALVFVYSRRLKICHTARSGPAPGLMRRKAGLACRIFRLVARTILTMAAPSGPKMGIRFSLSFMVAARMVRSSGRERLRRAVG